jgi:hypothetical protein
MQVAEEGRTLFQSVAYQLADAQALMLNDLLDQMGS